MHGNVPLSQAIKCSGACGKWTKDTVVLSERLSEETEINYIKEGMN
jgi:hypothetical protein